MKTYFIDLDGVLTKHHGVSHSHQILESLTLLPGALSFLDKLERNEDTIILCTARKESHRPVLEEQLRTQGIFWDKLIMGLPHGLRVLINDKKDSRDMALAINVIRNGGVDSL